MNVLNEFIDYLYDIRLLNRNGLTMMQDFMKVSQDDFDFEEKLVCKLANYIKSLSASDCYDLSSRLFQYFKSSKD